MTTKARLLSAILANFVGALPGLPGKAPVSTLLRYQSRNRRFDCPHQGPKECARRLLNSKRGLENSRR